LATLGKYILDKNRKPKLEPNLSKWAKWFENSKNRVVKQTYIGASMVSTVFLGTDHRFTGDGPPILWETLIFYGPKDGQGRRYDSEETAKAGHEEFVEIVRKGLEESTPR
jgi:hypothetical protein